MIIFITVKNYRNHAHRRGGQWVLTTKGFLIFGLSTDSKMGQSAEGRFSPDFPHFFPILQKKWGLLKLLERWPAIKIMTERCAPMLRRAGALLEREGRGAERRCRKWSERCVKKSLKAERYLPPRIVGLYKNSKTRKVKEKKGKSRNFDAPIILLCMTK